MVCKEDVLQWFRELESYERIDLMHELLQMCLPFEVRFLGSCVEELGKHSYQELRGNAIIANDIEKLGKDATGLGAGVLDRSCRHRMCIYLSLLENRNCQCAHWYFKRVFRTERWSEFAMTQKCLDDSAVLNELLMVFTLGRLHPAFDYHQKDFFRDVVEKLYCIREKKSNVVKNAVGVGMPNFPPGFGYPNQVPYVLYYVYEQPATHQQHQPQATAAPPAVNAVDPASVVHVKTSSSSTTQTSTSSSAGGAGRDVALTPPPPPPPGLQQQAPPPHFQPYEYGYGGWRQQPIYTIPDAHMMAAPPQPISPIVSQSVSPPQSRPTSPSPSNHSTSSLPSQHPQQQQQQQQRSANTPASLRGSKSSSLESQPGRMSNATIYGAGGGQSDLKVGDCESNHILTSSDDKPVQPPQPPGVILHQDWGNHQLVGQHHLPIHPAHYATFAPHHQMAPPNAQPPNGLRHCFATNYHPHHQHVAIDQQPAIFGYDLDYQQQQQLNDIQLENTLHQSGSSSNNSSNASSLNQSPPDTPASTPTPAHHGPGRGNRDGGIGGITEKLRVLNNVNSVPYMTPPPPPISDGGNMPPQQPFSYNVPYTSFGDRRPMFTRIPPFTHTYPAPPPLAPHQHHLQQQQQQMQGQGPPPPFITIGTTAAFVMPPIINSNGNNPVPGTLATLHTVNSNTNTGSLRPHHQHHHHHHHHRHNQHHPPPYSTAAPAAATTTVSSAGGLTQQPQPIVSLSSATGNSCGCCCNCGSTEHGDQACTAPHIDDIVTQAGYALDYDDMGGGVPQQQQGVATAALEAGHGHRMPDI